ncbi:MAG: bifunctional lysylphosphatidylglycerol synthetase/lysine--tRNA ligase LysX [Actinomycetota bacterium]
MIEEAPHSQDQPDGSDPAGAPDDANEQMRVRRAKRDRLVAAGIDPYPVAVPRTTTIAALRERYADLAIDVSTGDRVSIAGRIVLNRTGGKLCFATLRDGTGDVQVMLSLDKVGGAGLAAWKADADLGDHVSVTGEVITSRRGELSVLSDSWAMAAKALRPLPDKHKGLSDPEARVRQRYVDLIVNPAARRMLDVRSATVRTLRESLSRRAFLEVETPMLQSVQGGATARPFVTHHNALDLDLFLRIAPELYLKRLVVGGVDRVFEINRNFRNEGVSAKHNPEFTMLEVYQAYADYDSMAVLTRELVQEAALAATGSLVVPLPDGGELDLSGSWREVTVLDAISDAVGEVVSLEESPDLLRKQAERAGVPLDPAWGTGAVILEMYERLVEHVTVEPTFFKDFPKDVSPLTRGHRSDPLLAERWDLVVDGRELGTAYSELVDPVEQRTRLISQVGAKESGDAEAMELDEDFLRALEFGMPPTGGMGMGVDRLLMVLTGATSIRECILFPLVRPE